MNLGAVRREMVLVWGCRSMLSVSAGHRCTNKLFGLHLAHLPPIVFMYGLKYGSSHALQNIALFCIINHMECTTSLAILGGGHNAERLRRTHLKVILLECRADVNRGSICLGARCKWQWRALMEQWFDSCWTMVLSSMHCEGSLEGYCGERHVPISIYARKKSM